MATKHPPSPELLEEIRRLENDIEAWNAEVLAKSAALMARLARLRERYPIPGEEADNA